MPLASMQCSTSHAVATLQLIFSANTVIIVQRMQAIAGVQTIPHVHTIPRNCGSKARLQQLRVMPGAIATGSFCGSTGYRGKVYHPAKLCLGQASLSKASTGRNVSSAASRTPHSPIRFHHLQKALLAGGRAKAPDRRLAIASAKKISQQDFTEKAWEAVVAAPQVRDLFQRISFKGS